MPLARDEIRITAPGGTGAPSVVLAGEPFPWPTPWQVLELIVSERVGWRYLTTEVFAVLEGLYNEAHGRVEPGPFGLLVQFIEGTGSEPFTIEDWRGNVGLFVFAPDDGLQVIEAVAVDVGGSGEVGYYTGRLRFVPVGS